MGAWINFKNHIDISKETKTDGVLKYYGYKDLTDEFIAEAAGNPIVKTVQISRQLPDEAFEAIDRILALREDMTFRIYGLFGEDKFDLSCLHLMKHLRHLTIDVNLKDNKEMLDFSVLTQLENLHSLNLLAFDLRDYSFVKELSPCLEKLTVFADTMGGAIKFDCGWLKRYEGLEKLFLGVKAKKNIESIAEIGSLRELTLRGIKLPNFDFLRETGIESLALCWCGMNDLSSLAGFNLKSLELWRINKLEDISFISTLQQLESLKLQDLKHIKALPDMSALKNLQEIVLENVPIDVDSLPENLRKITTKPW